MKRLLVTGANGFLGQHLCMFLANAGFKVIASGKGDSRLVDTNIRYESADLTSHASIETLMDKYQPDIVIHNAAMSKPDECEQDRELCMKVNVEATQILLGRTRGHFVYLSTDFVFGENGPHSEDDQPEPLNFYGQSKLMAEQLITESRQFATIVRPVFMYGKIWPGMKPTFLHWVKNNLEAGKAIKVVSDQWRTPTFVQDICSGINNIIQKKKSGVFNLAGKDILSPYDMAIKAANVLKLDVSLIEKVTADTFSEPVKRARRSGLTITKAINELDYNPVSFEEGILKTFA